MAETTTLYRLPLSGHSGQPSRAGRQSRRSEILMVLLEIACDPREETWEDNDHWLEEQAVGFGHTIRLALGLATVVAALSAQPFRLAAQVVVEAPRKRPLAGERIEFLLRKVDSLQEFDIIAVLLDGQKIRFEYKELEPASGVFRIDADIPSDTKAGAHQISVLVCTGSKQKNSIGPQMEIALAEQRQILEFGGSVDFGVTLVGAPVSRRVRVRNIGDEPLRVTNLRLPSGFSLSDGSASFTLNALKSTSLNLLMSADSAGVLKGTLGFESNSGRFEITLAGRVIQPAIEVFCGDIPLIVWPCMPLGVGRFEERGCRGFDLHLHKPSTGILGIELTVKNVTELEIKLGRLLMSDGFRLLNDPFPSHLKAGDSATFQVQLESRLDRDSKEFLQFSYGAGAEFVSRLNFAWSETKPWWHVPLIFLSLVVVGNYARRRIRKLQPEIEFQLDRGMARQRTVVVEPLAWKLDIRMVPAWDRGRQRLRVSGPLVAGESQQSSAERFK